MGKVARWIDSQSPANRDKVVEAQNWGYVDRSEEEYLANPQRGSCLVDQVYGHGSYKLTMRATLEVAFLFDELVKRFGLARIVRACKLRAGKRNTLALGTLIHQHLDRTEHESQGPKDAHFLPR